MNTVTVYGQICRWRIYLPDDSIIILGHDSGHRGVGWFTITKDEQDEWVLIRHVWEKYSHVYSNWQDQSEPVL